MDWNMRKIFIFFSKAMFSMIYDSDYLQGKWFDNNTYGWKICWKYFWFQKIWGFNRHIPFPVCPFSTFGDASKIKFDIDNIDNFWKNSVYFQSWNGMITIGKGTWIAPGVGIITENHNPLNLNEHMQKEDVIIGDNCWIGMNAVLLPGVVLGSRTIVGAGAVVTKSFKEGNCVLAGVPAQIVKLL